MKLILFNFHFFDLKLIIYSFKLGIARNLYFFVDLEEKIKLKSGGFLTRNSLSKERRSQFILILAVYIRV